MFLATPEQIYSLCKCCLIPSNGQTLLKGINPEPKSTITKAYVFHLNKVVTTSAVLSISDIVTYKKEMTFFSFINLMLQDPTHAQDPVYNIC